MPKIVIIIASKAINPAMAGFTSSIIPFLCGITTAERELRISARQKTFTLLSAPLPPFLPVSSCTIRDTVSAVQSPVQKPAIQCPPFAVFPSAESVHRSDMGECSCPFRCRLPAGIALQTFRSQYG